MLQELAPRVTTSSPLACPEWMRFCSNEVIRSHPDAGSVPRDAKPLAAPPLPRMEIAGGQMQLTKGQEAVEVAGLQVTLDSITDSNIGIQVSR